MQKFFTSIALLGLLAAGCTKTDNLPENDTPGTDTVIEESTDYMTISILTAGGTGTRAGAPGNYEDGTSVENKVNSIRFYFFDKDFKAARVKKNPDKTVAAGKEMYDSFYDYEPMLGNEEGGGDGGSTVEKTIKVTLTLNIDTSNPPVYVTAVLNPTKEALVDNPALNDLAGISAGFLPGNVDKDEDISGNSNYVGKFVMSNSVYADKKSATDETLTSYNYSKITKLCKTVEETLKSENQTVIYVERVAARLDLTVGQTGNEADGTKNLKPATVENGYNGTDVTNVFFTQENYKEYNAPATDPGKPIFVKFLGWTVTSTPKKSNLLKSIDPQWDDNLFGATGGTVTEPWNAALYHRSFWGINPQLTNADNKGTTATTDYQFYSYNQIKDALKFKDDGSAVTTYIHENAAVNGGKTVLADHESKVIVAAQLLDEDGKNIPIAEYGFKYYKKNDLLKYFADQIWLYSSAEKTEGTKLSVNDLVYKTQAQYIHDAGVKVKGGYFSYVALSDDAAKTWYLEKGDEMVALDVNAVNNYINDHLDSRLLIWEDGMTYYYFTIQHLGAMTDEGTPGPGYYGVVRNHIYKADVNVLTGLGTPVLDGNEIIYPEKPDRDGHIFAAEIRVLQWRVVSQGYEFSW